MAHTCFTRMQKYCAAYVGYDVLRDTIVVTAPTALKNENFLSVAEVILLKETLYLVYLRSLFLFGFTTLVVVVLLLVFELEVSASK